VTKPTPTNPPTPTRCAIYTRKSTEEGLSQDFNSLDAQRESAEFYIQSQGWDCLPDRYDDGGFTGANTDRPGLKKLMADIEAGRVDCVIVYKVDRLSRSLVDFGRLMETFDKHKVSFVAVTQHFNTTHSMGRLTLNILLSFAQFEREIISERTRDKVAGARRRGKWSGGRPVLGYDIVAGTGGSKLVVNPDEAERVRAVFGLYLNSSGGLTGVVAECARRGWTTKPWTTKAGVPQGGKPLDKDAVYAMLTNVLYDGRVRHLKETYPGEHDAIVGREVFERVQAKLKASGRAGGGGSQVRNEHGALLKGLVRCAACGCGMHHHFASKTGSKSTRRYRYYVCDTALKRGWDACPAPSLPAGDLEKFVTGTIRDALAGDRTIDAVVRRATEMLAAERPDMVFDPDEMVGAIEGFDGVWEAMTVRERERLVRSLVERVVYDAAAGSVSVTFREDAVVDEGVAA
jgi:site-specific DNA recombinase